MIDRRTFIFSLAAAAGAPKFAQRATAPTIVLRSSWQTVNIGDIGHTPGVLRLLEEHIPEAAIRLWPSDVGHGVDALLRRRFPRLTIVTTPSEVDAALREGDLLLHGSGPSLVGRAALARWAKETGKPYGVYGITFPGVYGRPEEMQRVNPADVDLLTKAKFAYFRDSVSLAIARDHGVRSPIMEFAPDGAFAVDVGDEGRAETFLAAHQLEAGRFVCVIPRTRFTPYWEVAGRNTPFDPWRHARNEAMEERDHRPLRDAIVAVTRQTSMKVLVCPEDETQVALGKKILVDPLPADVKAKVVWRDRYWLTDEAVSTYRRSAGLFGLEMHSPIMCVGNGIPAIVCRFAEQTSKGVMWRDVGLGDWLFDMDVQADVRRIVPAVLAMVTNPAEAKAKLDKARAFVLTRQRQTMAVVAKQL
jgi:Polysaccharide pyruvyl transferase